MGVLVLVVGVEVVVGTVVVGTVVEGVVVEGAGAGSGDHEHAAHTTVSATSIVSGRTCVLPLAVIGAPPGGWRGTRARRAWR
jgi:hypothetical protein